jgi:hypothetical protein
LLVALWSPKGGSGTSLVAASLALALAARRGGARLADCGGDQGALLGTGTEPESGLGDWLAAHPEVAADALDRIAVDAGAGLALLPPGRRGVDAAPEAAGRALAAALAGAAPTVVDAAAAPAPAVRALLDAASHRVLVLRGCYLGLRRASRDPATAHASGVVVVEDPERPLRARDVGEVVALPLLGVVPVRPEIARTIDAGTIVQRPPDVLVRAADALADHLEQLDAQAATS